MAPDSETALARSPSKSTAVKLIKQISLMLVIALIYTGTFSQAVNQISINPVNPTANDTISVIADFSYYGNCSFGLVHSYSYLDSSGIHIISTYCGYGDTTLCHNIDTFKTGPWPGGNYPVSIEFHQGSICPVSGFDALIALFDTSVTVSNPTGISHSQENPGSFFSIYPNPSDGIFMVTAEKINEGTIQISDMLGKTIYTSGYLNRNKEINLSKFQKGIYCLKIRGRENIQTEKIIIK